MTAKERLRKKVRRLFRSKTAAQLRRRSAAIRKKLLALGAFKKADCICVYVSLPAEVDTRRIIGASLRLGKKVLVPAANPKTRALRLYEIKDPETDLARGAYGVLEPKISKTRPAPLKEADLVIVPGVAFDKRNHRVGRGAGYYDRFLAKIGAKTLKIGLAFSFQVFNRVPDEKHDQKLDLVITD